MATALQSKSKPTAGATPKKAKHGGDGPFWDMYRFLASVKLAVISLAALAAVLGYATFYESWYGTSAVQERIYQSWWFAALLATLAVNIFCAASIRFPWKRRQIGFVVTHAGLLIVLLASFLMARYCREGQIAFVEGERAHHLILNDSPVIRVRAIDPESGKPKNDREHVINFRTGAFAWPAGKSEVISQKGDPFQVKLKGFLPSSVGRYRHEAVKDGEPGVPMVSLALSLTPPGRIRPMDLFQEDVEDRTKWLAASGRLKRQARSLGPLNVSFQALGPGDSPTRLDDFLNPPKTPTDFARFHYVDSQGKPRLYEWTLGDDQKNQSVDLPDSDLKITYLDGFELPPDILRGVDPHSGETEIRGAKFEIRRGDSAAETFYGWSVPLLPNNLADLQTGSTAKSAPLQIGYFHPPHFDQARGQLDLIAAADGQLYHRYMNREGVKSIGPITPGKAVEIGGPGQPMAVNFSVREFIPEGRESFGFVYLKMPKGKENEGIPAVQVEMKVDGETKNFWLRNGGGTEPSFVAYLPDGTQRRMVEFGGQFFQVAYDVDKDEVPFSLKLVDFDVKFDRGTQQPKSFTSKVLLSDNVLEDQPHTITMNEPLQHGWWTCYQTSYRELDDPATGQKSGKFMSILQTRKDPVWPVMYGGCFLVVLGTFLQFTMRAGVFTDGGQRERARAAATAAKASADPDGPPSDAI